MEREKKLVPGGQPLTKYEFFQEAESDLLLNSAHLPSLFSYQIILRIENLNQCYIALRIPSCKHLKFMLGTEVQLINLLMSKRNTSNRTNNLVLKQLMAFK